MSSLLRTQPSFRPMRDDDIDVVIAMEHGVYPFPWTRGNFHDSLQSGYSCWVCQHNQFITGYAVLMLAAGEAHLLNVTIGLEWQGRGWGRAFMQYLIEVARDYHAETMYLEVRPSNTVARRLYHKLGFEYVAMRKAYYPARQGREDAVIMLLDMKKHA